MPVAFRVYGYGTDNFIDREKELRLMITAFENGFGPRLVATFKDGRYVKSLVFEYQMVRHYMKHSTRFLYTIFMFYFLSLFIPG